MSRHKAAILATAGLILSVAYVTTRPAGGTFVAHMNTVIPSVPSALASTGMPAVLIPTTPVAAPVTVIPTTPPVAVRPVEIDIASIKAIIPVINVGLTSTGNMDVPNNFTQAGWYEYGPLPGQQGSAVIAAHVDDGGFKPTVAGVFKHLDQVSPGDLIQAHLSNGSIITYRVIGSDVYETDTFPSEQVFEQNDGAYLKIITCHGRWQPSIHTYDQRLVVTALLVNVATPTSAFQ